MSVGVFRPLGLARHGNELHRHDFSVLHQPLDVLFDQQQLLRGPADRNHQSPAGSQFVEERLRNMIGRGRHDDDVERPLFRPAAITVAAAEVNIAVSQRKQTLFGRNVPGRDDLDGLYLSAKLGEYRRLIA